MTHLVVTSDWHLDAVTTGVSRFDELVSAAWQTVDAAISLKARTKEPVVFLFLGDLCDPDCGVDAWKIATAVTSMAIKLGENELPSVWLVGNHDVIEDGSGRSTLSPLMALWPSGLVTVASTPEEIEIEGVTFQTFPFVARANAYTPEDFVGNARAKSSTVVLSHLQLHGIVPGIESQEMARGREVFLPTELLHPKALVFNGHYHSGQVFQRPGCPDVHIPGALGRLRFDEESNTPSYLTVEV